jgi:ApeA N-terminal domain 1
MGLVRRCIGQWWLPEDPDRKVGGVLEIDNATGLRLELTDHLLTFDASGEPIPLIFGAADGKWITLLDTHPDNGGHTVMAQLRTTFEVARPLVAMVGIQLADAAEALFNGLEVEMTGLTVFAGKTGLKNEFTGRPDTDERTRFTTNWTDPIETQITDPLEATLGLHWHLNTDYQPQLSAQRRRYQANETVAVRVETKTPKPWRAFLDPIRAVQDLVTVATQTPSRIMSRRLEIYGEPLPHKIDLYFRGPSDATDEPQDLDDQNVIFTLDTVDFSIVIDRWFRLRRQIGLAVDVLLGLDYQPIGYYEVRLFNVAAAGEGFHAGLYPNSTAVDPAAHNALKKKVSRLLKGLGKGARRRVEGALETIQEALRDKALGLLEGVANKTERDWVMNQIGENRPGLNERYKELAGTADSEAVDALLTRVDIWAGWLRDARNAVGHVNTGQLQAKIPEKALYRMVYITRALLHLVLIDQLGISAEIQRGVVQELWGFSATSSAMRSEMRHRSSIKVFA